MVSTANGSPRKRCMLAYHSDASSHSPRRQVFADARSHYSVVAMGLHHTTPDNSMFAGLQVTPFCICVWDTNINQVRLLRALCLKNGVVTLNSATKHTSLCPNFHSLVPCLRSDLLSQRFLRHYAVISKHYAVISGL